MIQVVYYFSALSQYKRLEKNINFIVPTGNFGDIFAGYIAKKMGLPIHKLVIATNVNNILERCLKTGVYKVFDSIKTNTPSMDIQISSNFERLLFDLLDMSSEVVGKKMIQLKENGKFELTKSELKLFRSNFDAESLNQEETVKIIKDMYNKSNQIIDPHTAIAVGIHYKNNYKNSIVLSTAHAAKFPDTVERAIGINPALPNISEDIYTMHENITDLPNDVVDISSFITKNFSE
jgi:threonine synthase